mmetsp:Transcript_22627/g.34177  ORF Transcript_22627/g.34177 Transcript_22627/m.34177 type:complete len:374 (+) Transcript_22627:153-1274(+)
MSTSKAQQMASTAKEKAQFVWTSLKSMTMDSNEGDGNSISQRLRRVMDTENKGEPSAWDSVMKTMFGSCTNVIPDEIASPRPLTSRCSKSFESADPLSPTREKEEYFYSQFMTKDRNTAQQAISSVRSQEGKMASPPPQASSIPKPFPVSSPFNRADQVQMPVGLFQETAPPSAGHAIDCLVSFDDGISAISAHTLEEMVNEQEKRKGRKVSVRPESSDCDIQQIQSKESSLFSHLLSPDRIEEEKDQPGPMVDLSRVNSRHSKKSTGTRSTRSSHTSDFDAWRRDEQKYWNNVVQQDAGVVIKELPHVQTLATASSSLHSASPFTKVHPHETFPYEAADVINSSDQDEVIMQQARKMRHVLALTHNAELAEI